MGQKREAEVELSEREAETIPLTEMIDDVLCEHHVHMREQVARLRELVDQLEQAQGDRYAGLVRMFREELPVVEEEVERHFGQEEERLFPAVRQLEAGALGAGAEEFDFDAAETSQIDHQQENITEHLARMRRLTGNFSLPSGEECGVLQELYGRLADLICVLQHHVELEERHLIPRALRLVGPQKQ